MSDAGVQDAVVSKGAFAALIGVTPGRISQMIAAGTIGPDALEGEGRNAKVKVAAAKQQIRDRRDPGQALGNGLATRLDGPSVIAPSIEEPSPAPLRDDFDQRFKLEKLQEIQRRNRKAAEEEEARRGRFVDAADSRQQMTRLAGAMMSSFEGSLASLATAVSSKFGVPQRDVLHLLKAEFRTYQESASKRHASAAAELGETVESVIVQEGAGQ